MANSVFFKKPLFVVRVFPSLNNTERGSLYSQMVSGSGLGTDAKNAEFSGQNFGLGLFGLNQSVTFYTFSSIRGLGKSFEFKTPMSTKGAVAELLEKVNYNDVTFSKASVFSSSELYYLDSWLEVQERVVKHNLPTVAAHQHIQINVCHQISDTKLKAHTVFGLSNALLVDFLYPDLDANSDQASMFIKQFTVKPTGGIEKRYVGDQGEEFPLSDSILKLVDDELNAGYY